MSHVRPCCSAKNRPFTPALSSAWKSTSRTWWNNTKPHPNKWDLLFFEKKSGRKSVRPSQNRTENPFKNTLFQPKFANCKGWNLANLSVSTYCNFTFCKFKSYMVVGSGEEVILILLSVSFYINKVVLKKGVCRRFFFVPLWWCSRTSFVSLHLLSGVSCLLAGLRIYP